jgi:hypothetical protein
LRGISRKEVKYMAIFGIGAFYDGKKDMTDSFLSNKVACIGWSHKDAQPLYSLMKHIKVGDIIYIKAQPPNQGLIIKAVGIVLNDDIHPVEGAGEGCINVKWIWSGKKALGQINDTCRPIRNLTLYEEVSPDIQSKVLDLLLSRVKKAV